MRYLAHLTDDGPQIAAVTDDGRARAVTSREAFYADPARWRSNEPSGPPVPIAELDLVPPVPATARVLCVGLNYQDHIDEVGRDRPDAPNLFARWYASLCCDGDPVPLPVGEPGLDWEGELAVVIGAELFDVDEEQALAGVLGYTCFNDISARNHQRATSQWAVGKNADRSGPIGPWVVTADEYGSPHGRRLQTRYNGTTVQSTTTDLMIFSIAETIVYASRCMTLVPGDVLATGTPSGVGSKMDPPVFMGAGDRIEVDIEGIGVLTNPIVAR